MNANGQCFATDEMAKIRRASVPVDQSVHINTCRRTFNWASGGARQYLNIGRPDTIGSIPFRPPAGRQEVIGNM